MRVLVVDPGVDFSVQDVHRGLVKGLGECGATVSSFGTSERLAVFTKGKIEDDDGELRPMFPKWEDTVAVTNEMLRGAIWSMLPELVVFTSGFFVNDITLAVCRARGIRTCAVMTEQPYELSRELWLAERVDHVALNDPTHLDAFAERCKSVWYRPHAYDAEIHNPCGRTDDLGAVWIGTAYRSRIEHLEASLGSWPDGMDVHLGGNWQELGDDSPLRPYLIDGDDDESCIDNVDTVDWYRRARMSWNTYRKEAERPDLSDGWAIGPREVELGASATFFARESRPEGDALFPMLPIIDDPAELGEVMAWSESHPDERRDAARKAAEAVADRTFANSAAELLARCGF